jgi:hypothetical protein
VRKELKRIRWFDTKALDLLRRYGSESKLNPVRAEVIVAFCDLAYQILVKRDQKSDLKVFSRDRIGQVAEANLATAVKIAELFLERFEPAGPLSDADFARRAEQLEKEIASAKAAQDYRPEGCADDPEDDARHRAERAAHECVRRGSLRARDATEPGDPRGAARARQQAVRVYFVHGSGFNGLPRALPRHRARRRARGRAGRPRSATCSR